MENILLKSAVGFCGVREKLDDIGYLTFDDFSYVWSRLWEFIGSEMAKPAASSLALLILEPLLSREDALSRPFWAVVILRALLKLLLIESTMLILHV